MLIRKSKALLSKKNLKKIELLRGEFDIFRDSIVDKSGKLPKRFEYPKGLVERVVGLRGLGLRPSQAAAALGLSSAVINKWYSIRYKKRLIKTSRAFVRELKLDDSGPKKLSLDTARIVFRSGVTMEINSLAITSDLIRWIRND